ncbi:hypothetical protein AT746_00735 [Lacimicrobium alkaliphilum]|uniref:Uncharacterized protein n=1 Tax=Lacimicrobium alkaliphilum TaxID=1526571 RepID=A0A0U2Z224_9ALTE|nr:hypothetical protein AT746_00735 [Lacimicrobium alkaliphilum]
MWIAITQRLQIDTSDKVSASQGICIGIPIGPDIWLNFTLWGFMGWQRIYTGTNNHNNEVLL